MTLKSFLSLFDRESLTAILWFLSFAFRRKDKESEEFMEWLFSLPEDDRKFLSEKLLEKQNKQKN